MTTRCVESILFAANPIYETPFVSGATQKLQAKASRSSTSQNRHEMFWEQGSLCKTLKGNDEQMGVYSDSEQQWPIHEVGHINI